MVFTSNCALLLQVNANAAAAQGAPVAKKKRSLEDLMGELSSTSWVERGCCMDLHAVLL